MLNTKYYVFAQTYYKMHEVDDIEILAVCSTNLKNKKFKMNSLKFTKVWMNMSNKATTLKQQKVFVESDMRVLD